MVQKLWPGATIVILAGGPSLTAEDVEHCRGKARVIAIKDAVRLAPWADVLYGCDAKWWRAHPETVTFTGPKYALEPTPGRSDVVVLRNTGQMGLELNPDGLRTGKNSGFQAINLAVHLGATRIVLLGYDMHEDATGKHHWFGMHSYNQTPPPYMAFLPMFDTLLAPLKACGVSVVNASRVSELRCFSRVSLAETLARKVAA